MEEKERDFKGVWIPKKIWLNKDLSCIEKCLLAEIESLDNSELKGCFASNKYLGEFVGVTEGRMANIISDLKKRGYIIQCFWDGRNRGLRVNENMKAIYESESRVHEKVKAELTEKLKQTTRKSEHINTVNNTDINTKYITAKKEKIAVAEVPDFVKKEQEEKRKLAEQYTAGKLNEDETKEALYKDEKTRMSFKRVISQNEILSKVVTTDEAFRECFKHLIDEIVHNASLKEEFPRALVKSREHFSNFSKKLVAEQPERFKKLLIPR